MYFLASLSSIAMQATAVIQVLVCMIKIIAGCYEGQSISNASYFFSFTFQENSNTIT